MKTLTTFLTAFALLTSALHAQVPQIINYQGRVSVGTTNFEGSGAFKFALVNAAGTTTFWSNDGTSTAGSQPTSAVTLTVTKGLYSVLLGDIALPNMTAIPNSVFANADVRLRVWLNDGANGSQLLTPDQRLAPGGYLPDAVVTTAKLENLSVSAGKLADNAVTMTKIANGAVVNSKLANSEVTVTAGAGLGGGGAVPLGGGVLLTNAGVLSLTGGGGITVNAGTGAITLGSNGTTASTPNTLVLRDGGGNITATNFVGTLAGNVTGSQGATVVATVGGVTAGNVANGVNLANAATSVNTANTIVKRDGSGNFTAGTITGTFVGNGSGLTGISPSITGNLAIPVTTDSSVGSITQGGLRILHTYGAENFFAATDAGNYSLTGNWNFGVGYNALKNLTSGDYNIAMGRGALGATTDGFRNTAMGDGALEANTSGGRNVAIGSSALTANTTGYDIVAIGHAALSRQSFSNGNSGWNSDSVAIGTQALLLNQPTSTSNGIQNVAVGNNSLLNNTTGANNTALGNSAGSALTTGNNNIMIGNTGNAAEASTIRIGTQGTQTTTQIAGISGRTSSGGVAVFINTSGVLGTLTSSARFKQDIQSMDAASESLHSLRPVTFRYKPEVDEKRIPQWGLIAEEVGAVNPDLVVRDESGAIHTVRYEQVNAMLLNEFLKDHRRLDGLQQKHEQEVKVRDNRIDALEKRLLDIEERERRRDAARGTAIPAGRSVQ